MCSLMFIFTCYFIWIGSEEKKHPKPARAKRERKKMLFLVLVVFHYIQLKSICANFIQQQTEILILLIVCGVFVGSSLMKERFVLPYGGNRIQVCMIYTRINDINLTFAGFHTNWIFVFHRFLEMVISI